MTKKCGNYRTCSFTKIRLVVQPADRSYHIFRVVFMFVNNGTGVRVVAVNNKFGNSTSSATDVFCGIGVFVSPKRMNGIYIVGVESA